MQAALAIVLWRNGKRDWWIVFLLSEVARTVLLWNTPIHSHAFYWRWLLSEVASLTFQFIAVATATRGTARGVGLAIGAGVLAWSVVLTAPSWPTGRRAALMVRQAGVFGCGGALLASAAAGRVIGWPLAYYAMQVFRVIVEQLAITRERVETVNLLALFGEIAFFACWAVDEMLPKKTENPS